TDMVADDNNLYLSGSFSQTGPYKAYLLSFVEGQLFPDQEFPDANSTIDVIAPDGNGGYYVGGSFTLMGDQAHNRLAHILADGTIDPDFTATINSTVYTIEFDGANDMYIGGAFTQVNGETAMYLARLNRNTGDLDNTWTPPVLNSYVQAIAITANTIHIGGSFTYNTQSLASQYYLAM